MQHCNDLIALLFGLLRLGFAHSYQSREGVTSNGGLLVRFSGSFSH